MKLTAEAKSEDEMMALVRGIMSFAHVDDISKTANNDDGSVSAEISLVLEIDDPITVEEAAEMLGVVHQRASGLCRSGMLVAVKRGGIWQISRKSVAKRAANPPADGRPW